MESIHSLLVLITLLLAETLATTCPSWNTSDLLTLSTLSDTKLKEYEEKEYLRQKCKFYQNFRIKDQQSFQAWIYKQWGQDQFDLEDDFKRSNYENLYGKLLERFNYTQRKIQDSCRNIYYPEFNDTRERTNQEQFRGIYLIMREYLFKMDAWLRWTVDFMPYYVKKLQRDRLEHNIGPDGMIHFDSVAHQLEYERRIDERVIECKRMINEILYRHGNETLEEFAYEVAVGDRYFVEFNATVREDFIRRCQMFVDLRQKHHKFLQYENRREKDRQKWRKPFRVQNFTFEKI
uniref:Uncharacterized protein n=1 Tax=Cacopsylla melanoneura TaxID=428564 RepID=A0A8D8TL08_9HEMI